MALIFDLHQLIDMMSIGTLMAYTIVAICVLVLRYQDDKTIIYKEVSLETPQVIKQIFNMNFIKQPNSLSSNITKWSIVIFSLIAIGFCCLVTFANMSDFINNPAVIGGLVVVCAAMILLTLIIARQPVADIKLNFKVPMVPVLPCFSVLINLYLMFQLDVYTWIRFLVWLVCGFIIYFTYGIWNSTEGLPKSIENGVDTNNGIGMTVVTGNDLHLPTTTKTTVSSPPSIDSYRKTMNE